MLKQSRKLLELGILLALTHFAHAQQAADSPPDPKSTAPGPVVDDTRPDTFDRYGIDLTTYEFLVDGIADPNSVLNSSEQVEARKRSFLRLLDPDEYFRQFPRTDEEIKLDEESLTEIARPLTPEELAAKLTPEELAQRQKEMDAFLAAKQVKNPDDAPNAPGAISASAEKPTANP